MTSNEHQPAPAHAAAGFFRRPVGRRVLIGGAFSAAVGIAGGRAIYDRATAMPTVAPTPTHTPGSPAWSPLSIEGCDVWFDASQANTGRYAYDTFRRPNATLLGTTPSGHTWTQYGSMQLSGNAASMRSGTSSMAVLSSVRTPDYAVEAVVQFGAVAAAPVLIAHANDQSNLLAVTFQKDATNDRIRIDLTTNGTTTTLALLASAGLTLKTAHVVRVEVRLKTYRAYVDGVLKLTATTASGAYSTNVHPGFGFVNGDTTSTVTSFTVGADTHTPLRNGDGVCALPNLANPTGFDYAAEQHTAPRPTFTSPGVNALPVLAFAGSQHLRSTVTDSLTAVTHIAVIEQATITAGPFIGTSADGADNGFEFRVNSNGTVSGYRSGADEIGSSTTPITAGVPNIVVFQYDTNGIWACYINGATAGFGRTTWAFSGSANYVGIGYSSTPASTASFTGSIAEVIRWSSPLTGSQLRQAHEGLAAKWGVTLVQRVTASTPAPLAISGSLKGSNIAPAHAMYTGPSVWTTFWGSWDWAWVRGCIDKAKAQGSNAIRTIGDVQAVANGTISQATYNAQSRQIIDYCAGQGMRYYPCGLSLQAIGGTSDGAVQSQLVAQARLFAKYPKTVIGFDLINELATNYAALSSATAIRLAISWATAVRAAVPGLPLTVSDIGDLQWGVLGRGTPLDTYRQLAPFIDFFDIHGYAGAADLRQWQLAPYELTVDRPLIIGEFGVGQDAAGDLGSAAYYTTIGHLRTVSPAVKAIFQWAIVDDNFGLYTETGDTLRSATAAAWRAL